GVDAAGWAVGRFPAGDSDEGAGRDCRDGRSGRGPRRCSGGPFRDAGRVYVVRADRDGGDLRRGSAGIPGRAKEGTVNELKRELGPWAAASIVVGTVIGSGIFLVPRTMVQRVGTPEMVFFVWVFGGLLSLAGALSYAELSAAMPEAGGEYTYLREAYGPMW